MSRKTLVMIGLTVGSLIGGYIPALFGVSLLSFTSVVTSTVGGLVGIIIGYKLGENL